MPREPRQPRQPRAQRQMRPTGRPNRHQVFVPGGYYDPLKPDYHERGEGKTEAEAVKAFAGNHQPYRPLSWMTDEYLLLCDGVDTVLTHTVEADGTRIVQERRGLFG